MWNLQQYVQKQFYPHKCADTTVWPFCPIWAVFGPFLRAPGPKLGAPCFSKLVQNLRLGPPTARSTFVPLCSNRLGPPEPSDRHFGQLGLFLGCFWALEVPNLTNFVSGKWNEARGTLRVEKKTPSEMDVAPWITHLNFQHLHT